MEPQVESKPAARPRRTSIRRPASQGARWRASKASVDVNYLGTVYRWDEERTSREFARLRWGSSAEMPCPHCGTIDMHKADSERWRCVQCHRYFSVTTGTLFDGRQRPLRDMYVETFLWACGASGIPGVSIRMMQGTVSYNTTYTHLQKLREGLARGYNTGLISGVIEMDGAHASGHDAAGRRGRPLAQQKPKTAEERLAKDMSIVDLVNARNQKKMQSAEAKLAAKAERDRLRAEGRVLDPNTGAVLPRDRRMVMTIRRRSGNPGNGSMLTKVGVGMAETPEVAEFLARRHVLMPESILATDEGVAFKQVGKQFRVHTTVNHSETLVGPNGQHVNHAESFTARQDRAEDGIYLNIEPKFLHEYACETAFREDYRRVTAKEKTEALLFWALNVGKSQYWRNFTVGGTRTFEQVVPVQRQVGPSSGPKKRVPGDEMDVRPPR